jgi:hypothetical protein
VNIKTLQIQLSNARARVADLEAKLAEAQSAERKKVEVIQNDASVTLLYNGRRINARKNSRGRLTVSENKRVIGSDYLWGLNQLRVDIATGVI